jgi:hypothetical protein
MSAELLRDALREVGIECDVEPHGTLALLRVPRANHGLEDPSRRLEVATLAREYGFAAIALELA